MLYANISELKSSKIVLGTDYYGQTVSKHDAFRLLDTYTESGGNHIDTARIYGDGESESVIGEWLSGRARESVIIATKGAHPNKNTMDIPRLSLREIESDLDESLRRLRTDYIDLYWLHRDSEKVSAEEITESLNTLVKKGKIRYFGASNWKAKRIEEANEYAKRNGLFGFCASQIKFSPAITAPSFVEDPTLVTMDTAEYEFYKSTKMPVMAFAPQAKGFFSKLLTGGEAALSSKARERYFCEENLRRFDALKAIAAEHGAPIAAVVCAALCSITDFGVFPIIGGKNPEQIKESLYGGSLALSEFELRQIFG